MSNDNPLIDFSSERDKRIHELHEKRLQDVRKAFEQALPLGKAKKSGKSKSKTKKS